MDKWVDFHSHCLPGMDDGARDADMAAAMLQGLQKQGVSLVALTSHFHLEQEEPEAFAERRRRAREHLYTHPKAAAFPETRLGAEVQLYSGLADRALDILCLEGTRVLLLEFPYAPVKHWMLEQIERIAATQDILPLIAHIDRYTGIWSESEYDQVLNLSTAYFQINADAFLSSDTRRRLLEWQEMELPMVLGSDTHNLKQRAPRFADAIKRMHKSRYADIAQTIQSATSKLI